MKGNLKTTISVLDSSFFESLIEIRDLIYSINYLMD